MEQRNFAWSFLDDLSLSEQMTFSSRRAPGTLQNDVPFRV